MLKPAILFKEELSNKYIQLKLKNKELIGQQLLLKVIYLKIKLKKY